MSLAKICILLGYVVLISHQQRFPLVPKQGSQFVPALWLYENHYLPSENLYSYFVAREAVEQFTPSPLSSRYNSNLKDESAVNIASSLWHSATDYADVDARSRIGGIRRPFQQSVPSSDDAAARFLLNYVTTVGGSTSFFNPFMKTVYYISTTTATTTLTTSCIPAGSFSAGQSTVACRKRREIMEILLGEHKISEQMPKEDAEDRKLFPSQVVLLEASAVTSLDQRSLGEDAILLPVELASSKLEDYLTESHVVPSSDFNLREKRFFIASTTITSYAFVTTTTTKSLSKIGTSLSCLPSQFFLC